jgi:hydrogenase maturation protease
VQRERKITVLGLGNILLKDEGFGVHFLRWFSQRHDYGPEVRLLDGGTLGYRLLDIVTDTQFLIVVDVIKLSGEPGAVYRFTREEMRMRMPDPTTAHEVEFPDVLAMADLMGQCPEVVFLCVVPENHGVMDLEMSPSMTRVFPAVERLLEEELSKAGAREVGSPMHEMSLVCSSLIS